MPTVPGALDLCRISMPLECSTGTPSRTSSGMSTYQISSRRYLLTQSEPSEKGHSDHSSMIIKTVVTQGSGKRRTYYSVTKYNEPCFLFHHKGTLCIACRPQHVIQRQAIRTCQGEEIFTFGESTFKSDCIHVALP